MRIAVPIYQKLRWAIVPAFFFGAVLPSAWALTPTPSSTPCGAPTTIGTADLAASPTPVQFPIDNYVANAYTVVPCGITLTDCWYWAAGTSGSVEIDLYQETSRIYQGFGPVSIAAGGWHHVYLPGVSVTCGNLILALHSLAPNLFVGNGITNSCRMGGGTYAGGYLPATFPQPALLTQSSIYSCYEMYVVGCASGASITNTPTATFSFSPTNTSTGSPTSTSTFTPTATSTNTSTYTLSPTATPTGTAGPAPVISTVYSNSPCYNENPYTVYLSGNGFINVISVYINGSPSSYSLISPTQISLPGVIVATLSGPLSFPIVVNTLGGSASVTLTEYHCTPVPSFFPTGTFTPTSTPTSSFTVTSTWTHSPTYSATFTPTADPTPYVTGSPTPQSAPTIYVVTTNPICSNFSGGTAGILGNNFLNVLNVTVGGQSVSYTVQSTGGITFPFGFNTSGMTEWMPVTVTTTAGSAYSNVVFVHCTYAPTQTPTQTFTGTVTPTPTITNTWTWTPTPVISVGTVITEATNTFTPTNTWTPGTPTWTWTPTPVTSVGTAATGPTYTLTPIYTWTHTVVVPTQTATPTVNIPTLYPNPVRSGNTASIALPGLKNQANVRVQVFTIKYRKIQDEIFPNVQPGSSVLLVLADQKGSPLSNGLYYLVISYPGQRSTLKLLILR